MTWSGFDDVEARGSVPGGGRIDGGVLADLRMEGSIFGGVLRVLAGVTNLFDRDAREHPLGAQERRGLVLGLGSTF